MRKILIYLFAVAFGLPGAILIYYGLMTERIMFYLIGFGMIAAAALIERLAPRP